MEGREAFEFRGTKRFEVRRRIGAGGMGIVYEAYDRERDHAVALKTLRHLDAQALYRLKNEFRALQDLRHPNLINLGELIEDRGTWFFTMELVHGVDFLDYVTGQAREATGDGLVTSPQAPQARERVEVAATGRLSEVTPPPELEPRPRKHTFDEARLRRGLIGLAQGIDALHSAGKVHRDVKPTNILVTREGRVVLLDFGLVAEHGSIAASSESQVVGTAAYMAPEQAAARRTGPAADWHSVGVLLYEALTGRLPFTGSSIEILMDKQRHDPPPPRTHVPDVPPDLDALCVELLRFDPAARPGGREVLKRLGADSGAIGASASTSHGSGTQPFVGRDGELELMRKAWHQVRSRGEPVTVYLYGESGVGKSALIRQFTRQIEARLPELVVLSGRCYERESMHYKAFDDVIDELARHMRRLPDHEASALLPRNAALLTRVFPVLGRVDAIANAPQPRQEVKDPRELRTRVFAALRELLLRMADRHPLVIAIEDLQWADADSALLLAELLREPDAPPILLLISSRAKREPEPRIPGAVRRIPLQPLDPDSARQLARALLRRAALAKTFSAAQIAVDARGNPLFIDQLVRHAALSERADDRHRQLDQVIWDRVSRLPAPASFVLQLVCVAGRPLFQSAIAHASSMEPGEFARHVALLRVANLVRGRREGELETLEPYHDRVREAVLINLDDDSRKKRHARLAKALDQAGATRLHPQLVLHHFEAAGELEKATACAVEAGDRAAAALAFDRAAEFYRTAVELGKETRELGIQLKLGDALTHAGRGAEAADVFLAAARSATPRHRIECQRQAAEQLLTTGFYERGLEVLERLLAEVGATLPATPKQALRSLLWNRIKLRLRGLRWDERLPDQIPDRALLELDVYKTASHGLAMVDTVRGADFQARGLLLALKTGERERVGLFLATEAAHLASQGGRGIARAHKLLEQARRIGKDSGSHYLLTWTVLARGFVRYFEDRYASAAEMLDEVEHKILSEARGMRWELSSARMCRMWSLRQIGAFDEMTRCYREYVLDAEQRGDRYTATGVRLIGSITHLAADEPERARAELDNATWSTPAGGMHLQHWWQIEARTDLGLYEGRAAATLDELDEACEHLEASLLTRVQSLRANYAWCRGRLLIAAAAETGDHELLPRAERWARKLRGEGTRLGAVLGLLVSAGVANTRGDGERAATLLRRAGEASEGEDFALYAALAQRWEGVLLAGSAGASLTERADDDLQTRGARDPARLAATLVPGFG